MTQLKDSMSNIDKIKDEIERRKKRWMYDDLPIAMGRYYEDRDLLTFIDSLPEEKPSEDLEEAADKFEQEYFTDTTIGEAFIAGAEWQAKQLLKGSPLPEDTVLKGVEEGRRLEKDDLALSIDDIEKIHVFLYAVKNNKQGVFTFTRLSDEQYKEVLRRFKEAKK